jgi:hypothetical protein
MFKDLELWGTRSQSFRVSLPYVPAGGETRGSKRRLPGFHGKASKPTGKQRKSHVKLRQSRLSTVSPRRIKASSGIIGRGQGFPTSLPEPQGSNTYD